MKKFPILFESNETEFKTNGIGVLSDALQCEVAEELNGIFELFLVYPSSGSLLKEIKNSRIIYADASKEMGCQPFRIFRVNKLLNGLVNVYAAHISYDLSGIQLPPFETKGLQDGLDKAKQYSTTQNPFIFTTAVIDNDGSESNSFSSETPKSVRSYLMGAKQSLVQAYGGEFVFDHFYVRHGAQRGTDKGYRVRYGVNLIDLNQEESIEKTYTGFYPYYKDEYMFMDLTESYDLMYPHEIDSSKLAGKIMYASGSFSHSRIANVDLSPYFEIAPLRIEELQAVAEKYMVDNKIGIPSVSLDLRFEHLKNFPEYSNIPSPDDVFLGDTIHVDFLKLGISATARINTIVYDSLMHKNKRVSIGDVKNSVADSIVQSINTQKTPSISGDKVNLTGYVTFTGLGANGTTIIDGGRIQTGQIRSKNYRNDEMLLIKSVSSDGMDAGDYYFYIGDNRKYFTINNSVPVLGSIVYFPNEERLKTLDPDKNEIESVNVSSVSAGLDYIYIDPDPTAYLSEEGTMLDLENGEFISKQFAILNTGEAFFGGTIDTDFATLGATNFSRNGFSYIHRDDSIVSQLMAIYGYIYYAYQSKGKNETLGLAIGSLFGGNPVFNMNIEKDGNDTFGIQMNSEIANLSGVWKSTPFTGSSVELSEIVTKKDLVNLGLIKDESIKEE